MNLHNLLGEKGLKIPKHKYGQLSMLNVSRLQQKYEMLQSFEVKDTKTSVHGSIKENVNIKGQPPKKYLSGSE